MRMGKMMMEDGTAASYLQFYHVPDYRRTNWCFYISTVEEVDVGCGVSVAVVVVDDELML